MPNLKKTSQTHAAGTKDIISSIEVLRFASIFAIIIIHVLCIIPAKKDMLLSFMDQACRFAVPVFFLISGYLFGKSSEETGSHSIPWPYLAKLLCFFIAWTLIYWLLLPALKGYFKYGDFATSLNDAVAALLREISAHPINFCMVGYWHLWFLMALASGIIIVSLFSREKVRRYLLPVAFILYIIGLLGGSYSKTPAGITYLANHFNVRNGPFFSTIFVAAGWWIYNNRIRFSARTAFAVFIAGYLMHMAEAVILWKTFGRPIHSNDYVFGTLLFGIGIFMLALAKPDFGRNIISREIGGMVLGVYLIHIFVLRVLKFGFLFNTPVSTAWQIFLPFWTLVWSLLFVGILRNFKLTRWLVI